MINGLRWIQQRSTPINKLHCATSRRSSTKKQCRHHSAQVATYAVRPVKNSGVRQPSNSNGRAGGGASQWLRYVDKQQKPPLSLLVDSAPPPKKTTPGRAGGGASQWLRYVDQQQKPPLSLLVDSAPPQKKQPPFPPSPRNTDLRVVWDTGSLTVLGLGRRGIPVLQDGGRNPSPATESCTAALPLQHRVWAVRGVARNAGHCAGAWDS